ncbi:hypothetical protein [Streptomyces sp. 147326]|uniref:hypothetical protein n=1 Tax=Streptomyces sp. 147326 TaxID=3074379 RepID=UPI003857F156
MWRLRVHGQVVCRASKGSDTLYLTAVEYGGGTKMAVVRTGPTSAYVVKSRRGIQADAGSCSTGAPIYRVDASVRTGQGPVRVMDAKPAAAPACGCRPLDDARPGPASGSPMRRPGYGSTCSLLTATARPYASRSRLHTEEPGRCAGWGQLPLFAGSLSPIVA